MATPVILYTTAGMPLGARAIVKFYRPPAAADTSGNFQGVTAPNVAQVVPAGSASTGTLLGSYILESFTLALTGTTAERMGTYGEDLDKAVVRKSPTFNCVAQMAGAGTPTLCPGDYFEVNIGMTAASTTASPVSIATSRWFLDGDSITGDQNQANKFGLKAQFDRVNSGNIIEF